MTRKIAREGLSINKSFSIPLTVLEQILDEAEIMGKSASETVVILVRIGLSQRNIQRREEEQKLGKA